MTYRLNAEDRSGWRFAVWTAVFCAAALRYANFSLSSENPQLLFPAFDETEYINFGKAVAAGFLTGGDGTLTIGSLYGYFLGAIFYLFGDNVTAVRFIQIALDSLNVALIYAIGVKAHGRAAGLIAAIFYAVYGVAFFYTLLIVETTLTVTFTLIFMLALFRAASSRFGMLSWLSLGLFCAMGAYLRGDLLFFAPMTIAFYWIIEKPAIGKLLKHTAVFSFGLALALIPVALQNYRTGSELTLLNPDALNILWDNRGDIPELLYNKFTGAIGWFEIPENHSFQISARFSKLLRFPLFYFSIALALGAPGLAVGVAAKRKAAWLLIPVIATVATITVFHASSQLRFLMVPFLLIGAGCGFTSLGGWVVKKEYKKMALFGFVALFLYVGSISVPATLGLGAGEFNLARAYWKTNDLEKSKKVAEQADKKFPGQTRFINLLGRIALSEGLPIDAVKKFDRALKINPEDANTYHNLGLANMALGAPSDAILYFKQSIKRSSAPISYYALAQAYALVGDKTNAVKYYSKTISRSLPADPLRVEAAERLQKLRGG